MFIVVLGGGISLQGEIPKIVYQRLDKAIELYKKYKNSKIVVSGKYSFLYHQIKKYPPLTEAEKMAQYLLQKKIPKKEIILEKKSKDTIGNAYYLKKDIFIKNNQKEGIIITSSFHLKRVKYIFNKVFGKEYRLKFIGVKEKLPSNRIKQINQRQKQILEKTKEILQNMKDGDHHFLDKKLYKIKYYREKRPDWVINFVAQGK